MEKIKTYEDFINKTIYPFLKKEGIKKPKKIFYENRFVYEYLHFDTVKGKTLATDWTKNKIIGWEKNNKERQG